MPLFSFEGRSPRIDPTAFVAPTATLIGDVTIEAGASVWFNAVLRGDYAPVVVREGANVQDGAVLHAPPGIPVDIGPGATVAHLCVIHGVHVGSEALIANHATVLDGAVIGARCMFAAGLERIGFAAQHIWDGSARRVLAHATSGPALQQNLVAVMEGRG